MQIRHKPRQCSTVVPCFPRSRLGNANHILGLKGNGPSLTLNWSGSRESGTSESLLYFFIKGGLTKGPIGIREIPIRAIPPVPLNANAVFLAPFFHRQGRFRLHCRLLFLVQIHRTSSSLVAFPTRTVLEIVTVSSQTLHFAVVFGRIQRVGFAFASFGTDLFVRDTALGGLGLVKVPLLLFLFGSFIFGGAHSCGMLNAVVGCEIVATEVASLML